MASKICKDLDELAMRLEKDGYPTAILHRAAERMAALEDLVLTQHNRLERMYTEDDMRLAFDHGHRAAPGPNLYDEELRAAWENFEFNHLGDSYDG